MTNFQPDSRKTEAQINKKKEKDTAVDTTETQRIVRDCIEHLRAIRTESLEEMDKLSEMFHLPRLNSEETENGNR